MRAAFLLAAALWLASASALGDQPKAPPGETAPFVMAQFKPDRRAWPKDRGNCFHWKRCRGESIGNTWIEAPDYCKAIGGQSWMGEDGLCRDLRDGPPDSRTP